MDLTAAIAQHLATVVDVIVRTKAELEAIVKANPYRQRGEDLSHLHIMFLPGRAKASLKGVDAQPPEEVVAIGRQLHLLLLNGLGRSKLAADLAGPKGPRGTMRNWRTVNKLIEMAAEIR